MSVVPVVYEQQQKPGILHRVIGVIVLVVIILITALLIIIGYVVNTTFDYSLQSNPLFSSLPTAAKAAFGTVVSYQLTTYSFIVGLVIILAIAGTVAAIFGLQSSVEDTEGF